MTQTKAEAREETRNIAAHEKLAASWANKKPTSTLDSLKDIDLDIEQVIALKGKWLKLTHNLKIRYLRRKGIIELAVRHRANMGQWDYIRIDIPEVD